MVIRPKSIATVVSALRDLVSSVMSFSVDRTVISLIVRIRVDLPAAKGPVTTILTACPLERRLGRIVMSQPPYAGDEAEQQALVHTRIPLDVRRGRRRHGCGDGCTPHRRAHGHGRTGSHDVGGRGGDVLLGVVRGTSRQERLCPYGRHVAVLRATRRNGRLFDNLLNG